MVSLRGKMAGLSADFSNFLKRYDLTLKNIIRKKSVKKSAKKRVPLSPAKARELSERFKRTLKGRRLATAEKGLKDFLDRHRYDDAGGDAESVPEDTRKKREGELMWDNAIRQITKTRRAKGGRRRTRRRRRRRGRRRRRRTRR